MYTFKASPYSSHTLVLRAFPEEGAGRTVLDVGCGNGYLGQLLADRGYVVTGVERAGGYSIPFPTGVRLVEADLEGGLPDLRERFDYVLCADILEHLRRPADLLAQLRTVLKPGGSLIASLPNSGNLYFRLNVMAGRFPQEDKGLFDRTHLRFYMWQGWSKLLADSGWIVDEVKVSGIPIGLALPKWEDTIPVRVAERVCYGLARLRKSLFAYQFIVTAHGR